MEGEKDGLKRRSWYKLIMGLKPISKQVRVKL